MADGAQPHDREEHLILTTTPGSRRVDVEREHLDLFRGASPLGLPYTLSRAPLRRRAPFAWLARCARSRLIAGCAPRTPRHASLVGAPPPRSVRVARSLRSLASFSGASPLGLARTRSLARGPTAPLRSRGSLAVARSLSFPRGFAPRTPLHASLARRCAGSLRSRGSLAALARVVDSFIFRGLRPSDSLYTLSRAPLCRRAPFAWLTRCRSFALFVRWLVVFSEGLRPWTPLPASLRGPVAPRRSPGSLATARSHCS